MAKKRTAAASVLAASTAVILLGVVLGWVVVPVVVKSKIAETIALRPGSEAFSRWEKLPIPMNFKIYLFNVKNAESIVSEGAHPVVEEVGPYVYRERRYKEDIKVMESEDRAEYRQRTAFEFVPEESVGSDETELTVVNAPVVAFAQIAENLPGTSAVLDIFNRVLHKIWPDGIFAKMKVRNIVFDGVNIHCNAKGKSADPLEEFMWRLMCSALERLCPERVVSLNGAGQGLHVFSYFGYKNQTSDGPYEVKLGIDDAERIGEVVSWRGERSLGATWGGKSCNKLYGTDGTLFRPYLENVDSLSIFHSDVVRTVNITYSGDVRYKEVAGRRYSADRSLFASVTKNSANYCYCPRPVKQVTALGGCLKSGLLDLSSAHGAPILLSFPHLLDADPSYGKKIVGLSPDPEKHRTYLDVEPNTGTPLRGAVRIQMNAFLKKIPAIEEMKNLPGSLIPILWLDEGVELSDDLVDVIKAQLIDLLRIVDVVVWVVIGVGVAGVVASAAYLAVAVYVTRLRRR